MTNALSASEVSTTSAWEVLLRMTWRLSVSTAILVMTMTDPRTIELLYIQTYGAMSAGPTRLSDLGSRHAVEILTMFVKSV